MKRISSKTTYFHKRVFPVLWFGIILSFVTASLFSMRLKPAGVATLTFVLPLLIAPGAMAFVGYIIFRKLIFDLADEVYDNNDHLLVRNKKQEDRIYFYNIKNINYSSLTNPQRVTLSLRTPCRFGAEVSFTPPSRFGFKAFEKNPLISDLIDRVDQARQKPKTDIKNL